ncbi:hypothetical protein L6452_31225 [Arctium lappa]|uniref:Uncharacterized protein n=1 Tax=Arctium lappa TaxID=4217 RepID=A0ACB8ZKF7_ARCLA|nr:hypothetical protein L6452_31225 [Arctium lappa]
MLLYGWVSCSGEREHFITNILLRGCGVGLFSPNVIGTEEEKGSFVGLGGVWFRVCTPASIPICTRHAEVDGLFAQGGGDLCGLRIYPFYYFMSYFSFYGQRALRPCVFDSSFCLSVLGFLDYHSSSSSSSPLQMCLLYLY